MWFFALLRLRKDPLGLLSFISGSDTLSLLCCVVPLLADLRKSAWPTSSERCHGLQDLKYQEKKMVEK